MDKSGGGWRGEEWRGVEASGGVEGRGVEGYGREWRREERVEGVEAGRGVGGSRGG